VNQSRPKNLNLFTIHFPIPAIISILHRMTGFALFLLIPVMIWALGYSLTEAGFDDLTRSLNTFYMKFIFWLLLIPFCFHLVAGIRHLLSDVHVGDTLLAGKISSYLTFIISFLLIVLAGIWLW